MKSIIKSSLLLSLFLFAPAFANAASMYINPSSGSYDVGQRINLQVMVSSNEPINAVSGNINIPTNIFTIESVSKSNSILNFWVTEPTFSANNGTVSFEGVTLGGYSGNTGNIVNVTLRAKSAGSVSVTVSGGQILANDGQGTNITGNLSGGTFTVKTQVETPKPAEVKPQPKPSPVKPVVEEIKEEPKIEEPQPKPSLLPPQIILVKREDRRIIRGTSGYADSQVLITFESKDGEKVFITGKTEQDGSFEMFVPNSLKRGKYITTAIVIKSDMSHTYKSNELKVRVGNIISDISLEIWIGLSAVLLFVIVLIIKLLISIKKVRHLRNYVRKEANEAEEILKRSFEIIEEDLNQAIKTENNRKRAYKNIKGDLMEAKKAIKKEIKDIK